MCLRLHKIFLGLGHVLYNVRPDQVVLCAAINLIHSYAVGILGQKKVRLLGKTFAALISYSSANFLKFSS